jgi:hypothetical protein
MAMRQQIWNAIAIVKFKALYTGECSRWSDLCGRWYSFILALVATSSVATWALWERYPAVWALIVAVAQVFHVAKPYFPFLKNDKAFMDVSLEYEGLFLDYEKLWYDVEHNNLKDKEIFKRFNVLKQKQLAVDKNFKHVRCPKITRLRERVCVEMETALTNAFYPEGNSNAEILPQSSQTLSPSSDPSASSSSPSV